MVYVLEHAKERWNASMVKRHDRGFTLIELLVVVIIIGILAAVAIPVFTNQKARAYDAQVKAQAAMVAKLIETALVDGSGSVSGDSNAGAVTVAGRTTSVGTTDGVLWAADGSAGSYCIAVWHPQGGKHTPADPLYYDAAAGGFTDACSSGTPDTVGVGGPPPPAPVGPFTMLSVGAGAACGVSGDSAWCWGQASVRGRSGATTASSTPVEVDVSGVFAGKRVTAVAVGTAGNFACALADDSTIACWGDRAYGKVGDGGAVSGVQGVPARVDTSGVMSGARVVSIGAGRDHACAMDVAGQVYCWGRGSDGALGNGALADSSVPVRVTQPAALSATSIVKLRVSQRAACVVTDDQDIWCWGFGGNYTLGTGTTANSSVPVAVARGWGMSDIRFADVAQDGTNRICALSDTGDTYCAGFLTGSAEWLGVAGSNPLTTLRRLNVTAGATEKFSTLVGGSSAMCGLAEGLVHCWGDNYNGRFGDGTTTGGFDVIFGGGLIHEPIVQFVQSSSASCALTASGAAWCAGAGTSGQLGHAAMTSSLAPVQVAPPARP